MWNCTAQQNYAQRELARDLYPKLTFDRSQIFNFTQSLKSFDSCTFLSKDNRKAWFPLHGKRHDHDTKTKRF